MSDQKRLRDLLDKLIALPHETEWVEFKHNHLKEDEIGKCLSEIGRAHV